MENLPHKYDITSGIFPKYLQMTKKKSTTLCDFAWFYRRQPLKNIIKIWMRENA